MTVAELIEELKKHDPSLTVTVDGYEGGYTSEISIVECELAKNVNDAWYYGEHDDSDEADTDHPLFKALNLGR